MCSINAPRFIVIEVLCDAMPNHHAQDCLIPKYLADNELPAYAGKAVSDFEGVLSVHFLNYPEDLNLEVCVLFKVVSNG